MATVVIPPENALTFLKADLGYFGSTIPHDVESYLQGLIVAAGDRIRQYHKIPLNPGSAIDDQFIAAYAAWMYRDKKGEGMPESLKQEIRNRQVHKATSE